LRAAIARVSSSWRRKRPAKLPVTTAATPKQSSVTQSSGRSARIEKRGTALKKLIATTLATLAATAARTPRRMPITTTAVR